jgi:hypothetical protein
MIRWCRIIFVRSTDSKRNGRRDLVGDIRQIFARKLGDVAIGSDRGVPAGDIVAHSGNRDLVAIRGHSADRHDVA